MYAVGRKVIIIDLFLQSTIYEFNKQLFVF